MFLCVADILIDLLIGELRVLDRVSESTRLKSTEGLSNLRTYEAAVKVIGISGFSFYVGKMSQKLKWRTLTGPEKLLLFQRFKIADHFPDIEDKDEIQSLWSELLEINKLLSARPVTLRQLPRFTDSDFFNLTSRASTYTLQDQKR